jgi:hypothetical protein
MVSSQEVSTMALAISFFFGLTSFPVGLGAGIKV